MVRVLPRGNHLRQHALVVAASGLALLVVLTACGGQAVTPTAVVPAGSQEVVAPTPIPAIPAPTAIVTRTSSVLTLTWWTAEFMSASPSQPGAPLMKSLLESFSAEHRGEVIVSPVLKARYGKGGLLDFLRTAQPVAPSILPDIVSLDLVELEQAAASGLLQPLDDLIEPETLARLYPFATSAGRFNQQILAIQFTADVEHLATIRSRVEKAPDTWLALLEGDKEYLFPGASPQFQSSVMPQDSLQPNFTAQYLGAGGQVDLTTRQLQLDKQPLLRVLTFYSEGRDKGLLPSNVAEISSPNDTWNALVQGAVPMAEVSSRRYLAEREDYPNLGYAAIPGFAGAATPIATGWTVAIVTTDPVRQRAAAEFLSRLLQPEFAGKWTHVSGWLPTSQEALTIWGDTDYYAFLNTQLSAAVPYPAGSEPTQIATRLQKAAIAVLRDGTSPEDATAAAMNPAK